MTQIQMLKGWLFILISALIIYLLLRIEVRKYSRTAAALRESKERLQIAVEFANDGLFDWNFQTDEIYYSPGWKRLLGYESFETENDIFEWERQTKPEHIKEYRALVNEVLEGKRDRFEKEFQTRHKTGHWLDILLRANIIFDGNGKGVRVVGTLSDITARKQAEADLMESEARYKGVVEDIPVLICSFRPNGEITFVNQAYCNYFNKRKEELIGYTFLSLIPESDRKTVMDNIQALTIESPVQSHEHQVISNGDKIRWQRWTNRAIFDKNGKLTGYQSIGEDVTERKKQERELKFQALLLDQIQDNITATDLKGKIIYVNDAKCKNLKRSRAELIGALLETYGENPEKGATQRQIVERTLKYGEWHGEVINYTSDGTELIMDCRTKLIKDDFDNPISMVGISTDITEKKKIAERLQQAQKMESIGSLAGGIAHDFNNILFPIVAMSELLLDDLPPESFEHKNVEEIFKAGKRGAELVHQILAFSRQSEHKIIPVRIQQILKEVLKLSRATIPSNIEIVRKIQSDCGMIMADPIQIHQVAMNIITNAFHAVDSKGGIITIRLKESRVNGNPLPDHGIEPGRYAHLSISDNGHGISGELMDKIFEPYFTTKEQGKGTGLGLSVVYGIVKEHHGDINVKSEVGKGTTFDIFFPIIQQGAVSEAIEKTDSVPTGRERILLVDDETPIVNLEKQMLERLGYHVYGSVSSIDALSVFRANPSAFDLIITDMAMPNMTGDQLVSKIREISPNIPIIICTGFSDKIDKLKMETFGIKDILMKPVIKSKIANTIRKTLNDYENQLSGG